MMWLKSFINKRQTILCVVFVCIILVVVALVCPMVYSFNDDVLMRSIISGAYTGEPDGHAVYMRYPLTGFLSLLYRISDQIPWLSLFFCACFGACMCVALGMTWESLQGRVRKVLGALTALVVLIIVLFGNYVVMHYTIVAAVLSGTALFLFTAGVKGGTLSRKRMVWSLCFLFLSYMVRNQVFFMSLPFFMVAVLWNIAGNGEKISLKTAFRKWGGCIGALILGVVLLTAIHAVMYGSKDWREYQEYNESRTDLFDYADVMNYENHKDVYDGIGITHEQFFILAKYALILDEELGVEQFDKLADAWHAERDKFFTLAGVIKERFVEYYDRTLHYRDYPYNYVVLALYGLLFVFCLWKKEWLRTLLLFCLGGGRSLIWMYLMVKGRYPERVLVSLYLIEGLLLAGMLISCLKALRKAQKEKRKYYVLTVALQAVVLVCLMPVARAEMQIGYWAAASQAYVQEDWLALKEYMGQRDENFYYLDMHSMMPVTGLQFETVNYENYMMLGGWLTRAAIQEEKQENTGYVKPLEAIIYGENVYLVVEDGKDYTWLEDYAKYAGYELKLRQIDKIGRFYIYGAQK